MKRDFRWKVFGQNRNPGSEIPSELRYSSSFGFTVMIGESLHRLLLTRLDRMSHQPQLIFMWVFFPRSLIGNETKQSLTPESFQMLLSGTRPSCLILVAKKFYCTIWGGEILTGVFYANGKGAPGDITEFSCQSSIMITLESGNVGFSGGNRRTQNPRAR